MPSDVLRVSELHNFCLDIIINFEPCVGILMEEYKSWEDEEEEVSSYWISLREGEGSGN